MKCIILDERRGFLSDLETRLVLDDERDVELATTMSSTEKLMTAIKSFRPDIVVVCANLIDTQEDWDIGNVDVIGYALDEEGKELIEQYGLPSYGIVKTSTELLNKIEHNAYKSGSSEPKEAKKAKSEPQKASAPAPKKKVKQVIYEEPDDEDEIEDEEEEEEPAPRKPVKQQPKKPVKKAPVVEEYDDEDEEEEYEEEEDNEPVPAKNSRRPSADDGSLLSSKRKNERLVKKEKKKAKVVTVYAAKGGVGKTTISTELAVYLSLTYVGRGKLRVCMVDYNIDFGDVRSVLGFPVDNGADMSVWAMDIRDRIENGESPDDIEYTADEIEEYLQVMKDTNLYALLAPLSHEESMDIGREELDVMLRNIINNGNFDFVVCDTGNNTRDSTVYALMAADTILLVSTQDATTATCNSSSLDALQKFGLDMDKVKMVINFCRSTKDAGISVKEVEEVFVYPCIARIPYDNGVIKANNLSVPIVYQAKNDFTVAIRKIVAHLLGKPTVETDSSAKTGGLFSKLFGRK